MSQKYTEQQVARRMMNCVMQASKTGLPLCPVVVDVFAGRGEWLHVFGYHMGSSAHQMLGFGADPERTKWAPGEACWELQAVVAPFMEADEALFTNLKPHVAIVRDTTMSGWSVEALTEMVRRLRLMSPSFILWLPGVEEPSEQWWDLWKTSPYTVFDTLRPSAWEAEGIPLDLLESAYMIVADVVKRDWFDENAGGFGGFDLAHPKRREGATVS